MRTKSNVATILLLALLALAISACRSPYKEISSQELTTITDTLPDQMKRQLAENPQQRETILKNIKQMFSLAQAAEAEKLDKTEKFKTRLEIQTEQILAEAEMKAAGENGEKAAEVPEAEVTAYATAHAKEYETFINIMTADAKEKPTAEQIEGNKKSWAELKIRAERARKAGLEKKPEVQLQIKMQKAELLALAYQEKLDEQFKASPEELKEYYSKNPDADPEKIKQTADDVLKRAKAGEDFAALAGQYSADGSAANGGQLRWFGKGRMVPEFEAVAFGMQKGQISELVKTRFGYHIIKVEDKAKRKPNKETDDVSSEEEQELVLARHILLPTGPVDKAEADIKQKKMQRAIEDATLKYPVTSPADFIVNIKGTRSTEAPGATPNLMLPTPGAQEEKK